MEKKAGELFYFPDKSVYCTRTLEIYLAISLSLSLCKNCANLSVIEAFT
ncbi:MAG: hypothetical protein LBS79_09940 [Tannerella sp.]|nr:hypothetical protein [Tannerella sp.]